MMSAAQVARQFLLREPAGVPGERIDIPGWLRGGDEFKVLPLLPKDLAGLMQYSKALDRFINQAGKENAKPMVTEKVHWFLWPRPRESRGVHTGRSDAPLPSQTGRSAQRMAG